jgi:hypothetical protein
MSDVNYTSLHEIRREAGLYKQTSDTRVAGEVDGTNRTFYTNQVPIIDRNNDDVVTTADVSAFAGDIPVIVQAVDAPTGAVTLANAPEAGKEIMLAYEFSNIEDAEIEKRRRSAQTWLNGRVKGVYNLATVTVDNFPAIWEDVVRLYAGGLLQITDWGTNADTDGSSKDGYKKLAQAKEMLNDWISDLEGGSDGSDPNQIARTASFASDGNIVPRAKGGRFPGCDPEREFWNKRC